MHTSRRTLFFALLIALTAASLPASGQVVTSILPAGSDPLAVAINASTNMTYAANASCDFIPCPGAGTVTVINGATNSTTSVTVGVYPLAVAVDATHNKIYVANNCGSDVTCASLGTVTVIDANNNNNTTTVTVGYYPYAVAVDPATNQIYVSNYCGTDSTCGSAGTVTDINANSSYSTTTINVGYYPEGIAVNSATNMIYVDNTCGSDSTCSSAGTVSVIAGASNTVVATPTVQYQPSYLAVNAVTNEIYISNNCGNDVNCASLGSVSVISGASNTVTDTVAVGAFPYGIEANTVTNQIYVANYCGTDLTCSSPGTVTDIDGATNNSTTINVGVYPVLLDIDSTTNEIYVANSCGNDITCSSAGTVTVIFAGMSNATTPVAVGDSPTGVAVNATTDRVYIPNNVDGTVSVISGDTTLQFVPVAPCRLLDTRTQNGGGGPIQGGTFQTFNLPQLSQTKSCGNLSTAAAYSLNVTAVPHEPLGFLTIWPASENLPVVSTLNSVDGRVKAAAVIVVAGVSGSVSVYVSDTSDVILDIDGYFTPTSGSTLAFYTLTPCRVVDTRGADGPLGGPYLSGGVQRDFPVLESSCFTGVSSPAAYSFNVTAVPHEPLGYLTVWPAGQTQPGVSTLNAVTGAVTANAAIVPAGTGGDIDAYASNDTDLLIDVNGYFAAPGGSNPLSLYPTVPCRVLDTRNGNGAFQGELSPPVDFLTSPCGVPSAVEGGAVVVNATVVPSAPLGYLTLWPDGSQQPVVSTLNAVDGTITSNLAIVPITNGKMDAYASSLTQLIIDISSYFAP